MAYWLFIALNATLFLRPAELVPALAAVPLYQIIIIACAVSMLPMLSSQFESTSLRNRPISVCVLGVALAIPISHLQRLSGDAFWMARYSFLEFAKVALFYFITVGLLRSEVRLEKYLRFLLLLIVSMATLSLAHHFGLIYVPSLASLARSDGIGGSILQLRGTGIFNDPNDLAMILVVGFAIACHVITDAPGKRSRALGLIALVLVGGALFLTQSRGGMLAFLASGTVLAYARWGWRRTLLVAPVLLLLAVAVFSSRGGAGVETGTAQSRLQYWSEGISLLKASPIFGIGFDQFAEEIRHVAHNSFVHTYVELGLVGGTAFFGCFFFAIGALIINLREAKRQGDRVHRRYASLALAMTVGLAVSMLSLSRAYVVPSYLVLALASVITQLNAKELPIALPRWNFLSAQKLSASSAAFFCGTYVFMRVMVRWN